MPPDQRVLAVCAMGMEAWGVRRRARGVRVVKVGIGGTPPGRAAQHSIVISTGLCGGLTPDQVPGMVVIGTTVADERGATFACDPQVVAALERAAQSLGFAVVTGPVISTLAMVTGADRATWAARGHVAVDMESALAAPTARRFGVLRVILDTPSRELSPAWAKPGRAILNPANWGEAIWLAVSGPRYSLRAGAVLEAALFSDVDPEV